MTSFDNWPWQYWAHHTPHSIAVRTASTQWSWLNLAQRVNGLADAWQQAGVTAGCGVALRGKNRLELVLAYLAVLQCGARVIPLNPQLPSALLAQRLPSLNIDFGWCGTDFSWPDGITSLEMPTSAIDSPFTAALSAIPIPWQINRLATLTLTSGSSGLPKAAAHTFAAHLASAEGILALMTFQSRHSWLLSLPLYHVSGQGIVWRVLAAGATIVLADDQPLDQGLAGCSHASLVPTQLWRLLKGNMAGLSLQDVLLGGAMIPQDLTRQAEAAGIRCWCGYGLTEFASTACAKRADASPGVGMPLPGRELRLVDDEVWLRGNSMASGYWQQGRLIPFTDSDGWFHTRDRGRFVNGELHIAGRLDNVFICGGEGIQPEDIERVLATHPGVRQAFVVPVADEEFGQRPVVVVEGDAPFEQLRVWLDPQLAPWQRPVAYFALPDNLGGGGIKISRRAIMEWAAAQFTINP